MSVFCIVNHYIVFDQYNLGLMQDQDIPVAKIVADRRL
jgi:hypothetical protein